MVLIDEKTEGRQSRATVPLNNYVLPYTSFFFRKYLIDQSDNLAEDEEPEKLACEPNPIIALSSKPEPDQSLRIFKTTAAVGSVSQSASDNTSTKGQSLESIHSEEDDSQFEENNFALLRRSTVFKKQCHLHQCQISQSTKPLPVTRNSEDKTIGSVKTATVSDSEESGSPPAITRSNTPFFTSRTREGYLISVDLEVSSQNILFYAHVPNILSVLLFNVESLFITYTVGTGIRRISSYCFI
jgi:hypothetical protein